MELLSYVTRDDMLYVILEDDLYQIDIKQKSFQIVKEKLIKDRYVVSKSQASLAWMDQEEENACTQITVMSWSREIPIRSRHSPGRRSRHWDL